MENNEKVTRLSYNQMISAGKLLDCLELLLCTAVIPRVLEE